MPTIASARLRRAADLLMNGFNVAGTTLVAFLVVAFLLTIVGAVDGVPLIEPAIMWLGIPAMVAALASVTCDRIAIHLEGDQDDDEDTAEA